MGRRLRQVQLAGAGDGFGAALHLEFVEDVTVVPFDGVQGQENRLPISRFESPWVISLRISNSWLAQWLDQRRITAPRGGGRKFRRWSFVLRQVPKCRQ